MTDFNIMGKHCESQYIVIFLTTWWDIDLLSHEGMSGIGHGWWYNKILSSWCNVWLYVLGITVLFAQFKVFMRGSEGDKTHYFSAVFTSYFTPGILGLVMACFSTIGR